MKELRSFWMTIGTVLIIMLLATAGTAQTVQVAPTEQPTYRDTGNPEADQARYAQQKQAWIDAHPAEYKAINANAEAPAKENLAPVGVYVAPTEGQIGERLPQRPRPTTPNGTPQPSTPKTPDSQK